MMRLRDDLVSLCEAAVDGKLEHRAKLDWDPRPCLGVVMASGGYPGAYDKGVAIAGLDRDLPDTKVFHAGTALVEGQTVTAGGRVLCVCALDDTIGQAQTRAYQRLSTIAFANAMYRTDIGYRAV